jgi:predicted phosphodiesterase
MGRVSRLAVLSDVHGNLVALRAVLADADAVGVDGIVVAGDLSGFGPNTEDVVDLLCARHAQMIRGNHEKDYVAPWGTPSAPPMWAANPRRHALFWLTMERLGPARRAHLSALPDRLALDEATLVVHGSPRHVREGLLARDGDDELVERFRGESCRLALSGHTHRPLRRELPDLRLVNVGSVGLPLDGDPRAAYVVIEREPGAAAGDWQVELRRVAYDLTAASAAFDNGFRQAAPELVDLIVQTMVAARDHFAPGLRATAEVLDAEFPIALRRYLDGTA